MRTNGALVKECSDSRELIDRGMTIKESLRKLKFSQPPPTGRKKLSKLDPSVGTRKYLYLQRSLALVQQQGSSCKVKSQSKNR